LRLVAPEQLARRYVAWLRRRAVAIVVGHLIVAACAVYLIAFHLPLFADFSYLLPQTAPAVRDLRKLEARVRASETIQVVIQAPTPELRALAAKELDAGVGALPKALVDEVEDDDSEVRSFAEAHKFVLTPLADLERARDALAQRIKAAKLEANPLYIDLDKDPKAEAANQRELDDLRAKRRAAEAKLHRPGNVSTDGLTVMIQVRTAFRGTDAGQGQELLTALETVGDRIVAAHPGVVVGFTGGIVTAVAEHDAIFKGMVLSSIITTLLVALVLALYFRSATLLVLLIATLGIATAVAFGAAALTIGHLNAATAFLGAIIAGNGVNYGILLIARFLEERIRHETTDHAMAAAIVGTLRPTAVASLGAAIAYGSLAATSFKGFADFAVIGAIGMILCWLATYLLLPAIVLRWGRHTRIFKGDPVVGSMLVKLIGFRRSRVVCAVAAAIAVVAALITYRYIASDPFEYDIKQLRSEGHEAVVSRHWMQVSDDNFGRGYSGRTFVAAERLEQVPLIVAALRARDVGVPPDLQTIGSISSILDVIPNDQQKRLTVLDEIRKQLDDPALEALEDSERAELAELRPPDHLKPITLAMLPPTIVDKLVEKDGRIGYLISIRPALRLDEWNGHDLIKFSNAVRELDLPDGEQITTSGPSVIFADIVESIQRDGPVCTAIAALGLMLMVVLLVGRNLRAVSVLVAIASGSLLMVAVCALLGIRVNFLDFVALPITLGIGVDYAINIAYRQTTEAHPDPLATLRTSGSAVFVCSLTTIIGYGSLLVSDNLAIVGFGTASLIGEVSCLLTALILVPAILAVGRKTGS
jgi:uncharacterized protein